MKELLREWAANNKPTDDMLWKDAFWQQISLVRYHIAGLLARTYDQFRDMVEVVGTHTSKSITCPVYHIHLNQDGVEIWMRYNFFNWNITIHSDEAINCDFLGVVSDEKYDYCYCEGMEKWKSGKMADSKFKFTVCISSHYDCYTFFRVLKHHLKIVPDKQ